MFLGSNQLVGIPIIFKMETLVIHKGSYQINKSKIVSSSWHEA